MENILNRHIAVVLYLSMICWVSGCQKKAGDSSATEYPLRQNDGSLATKETSPSLKKTEKEGFYSEKDGESIVQMIYAENNCYYESTISEGVRINNFFYPKIQDAFLFEDKFYLKVSFPVDHAGKVAFSLPRIRDYVKTAIEPEKHQVVINDALDLSQIEFELTYHPAEGDTLVKTEYSFMYVIFE
ncbi:hypothetical protein [Negadavirga shengliensis]|uniref:Lipoprotein n=1 Tax=Negadavirga shengliensis TaxID=1389218 RepID=A0ABV9T6M2_9BACT